MTITIEGLKEKARRHEQDEEWRKALDLYLRAIHRLDEEDRPDIGLHNRVGDLYTRVGDNDEAVEHYETAVDLYDEAGLANNAIAVCKKIIRNVPSRNRVFLRMGSIRARQGFLVDARHHFLTYAERMKAAGDIDEALRALVEFADLVPDDAETRLAIASQFEQHDRPDEAVAQLTLAYASLSAADDETADEVGERLRALDPAVDLAALAAAARPGAPLETTSFSTEDLGVGAGVPEIEGPDLGGFEIALAGDEDEELEAEGDDEPSTAMESAREDVLAADADEAARAAGAPDDGGVDIELEGGFTLDEPVDEPVEELVEELVDEGDRVDEPGDFEEVVGSETDLGDDLGFDDDRYEEDDDEGEATPLPFLEGTESLMPPIEPAPVAPGLPDLEAADAWTEPESDRPDSDRLDGDQQENDREGAAEHEESGLARDDARAAMEAALEDGRADVEADEAADEVEACQRAVERAFREGSETELVAAYLGLAGALERSGAGERARGVYQQVLGIDPGHEQARSALGRAVDGPAPAPEVASSEDYVDLGALILGDDAEKSTRFVVAYEEPSGDEDADFARMLSQFKAKVAENVDSSDVKAHHDLGVAYREMGLLDEAIEQFQKALRASKDHLATYEALGQAFLDKGAYAPAVRVLSRALDAPWEVEDELLGIYYYLGRAYEAQGNSAQAVEFYDRVFSLDINFADVTERLRVLR